MVQACPNRKYDIISLGIFLEHDTANPVLIATSDVIQIESDIRTDIGYIIPQSKVPAEALEKLADKVGKALLHEQYIGFFGVDIVAFKNESNVSTFNSFHSLMIFRSSTNNIHNYSFTSV